MTQNVCVRFSNGGYRITVKYGKYYYFFDKRRIEKRPYPVCEGRTYRSDSLIDPPSKLMLGKMPDGVFRLILSVRKQIEVPGFWDTI